MTLAENTDTPPGLILPNGDINWNCPCLGGMAVGPCGVEFREAFSCFHYSEAEPKGADCIEKFASMQDCMKQYPKLYDETNNINPTASSTTPETTEQAAPEATQTPDNKTVSVSQS